MKAATPCMAPIFYMYYMMYPALYISRSFCPSDRYQIELPTQKFRTLENAVNIAKTSPVALREINWYVYECDLFHKYRISLKALYDMGLFKKEVKKDEFGEYYIWK